MGNKTDNKDKETKQKERQYLMTLFRELMTYMSCMNRETIRLLPRRKILTHARRLCDL